MSTAETSTRAVERALDLLAAVCVSGEVGLSEAARRAGVPTSTALRLLRTLERRQFVVRDDESDWRPGPRLLQLAVRSLGREPLARLARPGLARLAASTGESAYLSVLGGEDRLVHLAAVEGTHPVRYAAWIGHTEPVAGSAVGAALSGPAGPLGYVTGSVPGAPDVVAVSAAVRRPGGILAAISVVGPAYRFDAERVPEFGASVLAEAGRLETAVGAVGGLSQDAGQDLLEAGDVTGREAPAGVEQLVAVDGFTERPADAGGPSRAAVAR